jgi:UDP-N-acetyl-D-glucosamine dehydrogenase
MKAKDALLDRLAKRSAVIGIIGLGYVGLPLMNRFTEQGFRVIGFDVDSGRVALLNRGQSPIRHIPDASLSAAVKRGFAATTRFERAAEADVLIVCVPTPLDEHREPDLSHIRASIRSVLPHLRAGQAISLESTSYPGTTEEEFLPLLRERGLEVGRDVFLMFSPEREDPGNERYSTRTIPKIVGGTTPECLAVGQAIYGAIIDVVVPVSSTRTAELVKLLENIHRAINIGLVNEMKVIADKMGIDIFEVVRAAATKPFGFVPYYPGPGLGGHCIPVDPFYLTWKAHQYGVHTRFIELAGEINRAMPAWVLQRIADALNDAGKPVKGSRFLILGVAYKKNIDDIRESPSIELIRLLSEKGGAVAYSDPYVPAVRAPAQYPTLSMQSTPCNAEVLVAQDCVVIATDHDAFDYELIRSNAALIVDTRGRYNPVTRRIVRG